jgi:chromosomal replication initiator protein
VVSQTIRGVTLENQSAQELWEVALGALQLQVSKSNYKTWLEKTVGASFRNNQFTVGVPNTFIAEYLDKNQRSLIEKTLIGITQRDIEVIFYVNGRHHESPASANARDKTTTTRQGIHGLNHKYTFDSFVEGNTNRFAYAAALGVAQNPGHSYNPLFICGGTGLGKTHLLHAIGHMAQARHIQVLYVSAERFTTEFITAIREKRTEEFGNKYRSVDVLLIDDIHFISGKGQTEEAFFHTFDELHNANHQIVLTSNLLPRAIPQLNNRLRSRCEGGLVVRIEPPDFETCLAILHAKAKKQGVSIPSDVLEFMVKRAYQNIRELEGGLNRIIAYARLTRAPFTPELAARAHEDIASKRPKAATITPGLVLDTVASSFQLTIPDLTGRKKDKETALARQIAMYLIRQKTNSSLVQIGLALGDKNAATVSYACTKIARDIDTSPYLQRKISDIQQTMSLAQKDANGQ